MIDYGTGPDLLEAVERFDLVAFVKDHGATQKKKNEWALLCPSCGKEKLIVNTDKKTWHCWVCQEFVTVITPSGPKRKAMGGAGGLLDLIQKLDEIDRKAAIARVLSGGLLTASDLAQIPATELVQNVEAAGNMNPEPIMVPEQWRWITQDDYAQWYCEQRGLTQQDVLDFGLFWCSGGRYANRLVFPVYERGRFVYFQARAMWESRPGENYIKALNPSRVDGAAVSSEVLFNLDQAAQYPRVCITEAPIDCIHAGLDGVATFGKMLHVVQIAKLLRAGVKQLDFMWDADAFKEACVTGFALTALFDVRIVQLPHGDPGDFSRQQLNLFRQRAQPISGIATI